MAAYRKCHAESHYLNGKHTYERPQADDPDLPDDKCSGHPPANTDHVLDGILRHPGDLAGRLDIPVTRITNPSFRDFLGHLLESGAALRAMAPGVNLWEVIPAWSHPTIAEAVLAAAQDSFHSRLQVIARDIRFVCFLCDAGTVLNTRVVHGGFANPSCLPEVIRLLPCENLTWDALAYERFFRETIVTFTSEYPSPEICGIICDNLPAQVSGLHRFLSSQNGRWAGITQIPCLNHMINLVFAYVIKSGVFLQVSESLPEIIRALSAREERELLGRRCQKLIRSRWMYLIDSLSFILNHLTEVQAVLA
jgi:hypothetical protein